MTDIEQSAISSSTDDTGQRLVGDDAATVRSSETGNTQLMAAAVDTGVSSVADGDAIATPEAADAVAPPVTDAADTLSASAGDGTLALGAVDTAALSETDKAAETPVHDPGAMLAQGGSRRTGLKRQARHRQQESSELSAARKSVSSAAVQLTPAEEVEITLNAESEEEARELRREALEAKRQRLILREAKARVNHAVPIEVLNSRPTYGRIEGVAVYHSHDTYALIMGRNVEGKGHISGLFEAAQAVRQVVQGYIAQCPYAAWFLAQIEEEIKNFRALAKVVRGEIEALIAEASSMRMKKFASNRPSTIELHFPTRYGFQFADLLGLFDENLRILRPYEQAGFVSKNEFSLIRDRMAKPLRRIFYLPTKWSFVGRDAVLQQTSVFFAAEHKMGILPQEFINGDFVPQFVDLPRAADSDGEAV